jgi:ribulose-phosphate 3-epimerase
LKISASIYSDKRGDLKNTIAQLDEHGIDMLHVDCNDDMNVMHDMQRIRTWTNKPMDLHIISEQPEKYYDAIRELKVEYTTFQYEQLNENFKIPDDYSGKLGMAITSHTPIEIFDEFKDAFDFILIMATIPGQSGGKFNHDNFKKIRAFRKRYPKTPIHVDGGVDGEISFILRNMGIASAVSGSFLFNHDYLGAALLNLKSDDVSSHYYVRDFKMDLDECPVLNSSDISFIKVLKSIDDFKFGFTIFANPDGTLKGIVSNADVRKGLLNHASDLNQISVEELINKQPITAQEDWTISELVQFVKRQRITINYLPVINTNNEVTGGLTFQNLIKGEL